MVILGGRLEVTATRFPWQKGYSWKGMNDTAPLNPKGARFGGGWKYALGFRTAGLGPHGLSINCDALFGIITIRWRSLQARRHDYVNHMIRRLRKQDPLMAWTTAQHIADSSLDEWMAMEGVKFGDRRYSWDEAAARSLIEEWHLSLD